jgi:hypothetical protein
MHHAYRVLYKLLTILKTVVIRFSRQISYLHGPYRILRRLFGTLASKFMRSSAVYASTGTGLPERRELERDTDNSPVAILPSFHYHSESGHHSVDRCSGRTHALAESSPPDDAESSHVSLSIVTSMQDSASSGPILKPMTASDVRRYSKKSQMYVLTQYLFKSNPEHPASQRTDTAFMIPAGRKDFSMYMRMRQLVLFLF